VKRILDRDVLPPGAIGALRNYRRQILELIDGIADRGAVTAARRHASASAVPLAGRARIARDEPDGISAQPGAEVKAQARAE
jgi:hypothetical protein